MPSRDDKTNPVTFFTSFTLLNYPAKMIDFPCGICSRQSPRCSLRYNLFGSPCCIFQTLAVVRNWSASLDLIPRCRISERDEPLRSLADVLIDTPLSYRSKAMVTLLNAKDAFPRSQTTRLRLYNVHVIHDIGRHMNWMLVSQAVIHLKQLCQNLWTV